MRSRGRPTSPSTWPPAKPTTVTSPGSISVGCGASSTAPNGSIRRLWNASRIGLRTSISGTTCCARHTAWRRQRSSWQAAPGVIRQAARFGAVGFDVDELCRGPRSAVFGRNQRSALVRYELPQSPVVRIVDVDTHRECTQDVVGEIWVHGDNVAAGYWSRPPEEQRCFGANTCRPFGWHAGWSMVANRRSGLHLRGRVVRRRPHQGSADHPRAQSPSRGHRGDGPRDHPRPGRGDIGSGEQYRESGHGHRAQEAH